jgi:hypothetical protein
MTSIRCAWLKVLTAGSGTTVPLGIGTTWGHRFGQSASRTRASIGSVLANPKTIKTGAQRAIVEYAWPDALEKPTCGRPLVYLDLNHWIGLAKANVGHTDGARYRLALDQLRSADAVFPLSSAHYMEMSGIKDPRQRRDVADVMEALSGFTCLMPKTVIAPIEIDAALRQIVPGLRRQHDPIPLLGLGVLQAFGMNGDLRVKSTSEDVTDRARSEWHDGPEAFDAWKVNAERTLDRSVLRGPASDGEASDLTALGWDPTVAERIAEERAQHERDQAALLEREPHWRRGRLRDIVAARYLSFEVPEPLNEILTAHGLRLTEIAGSPETARRFTDSMPSGDVWISLLTAAHRNGQTDWSSNDIFDFDALSVAVPYCDAVVTERHARHVLMTTGVAERLKTEIFATVDELGAWLQSR